MAEVRWFKKGMHAAEEDSELLYVMNGHIDNLTAEQG